MPFSATQTRGLLLRGSGGSKRSVITPYQQGVSGRSVLTPWRQDGPFATASRVAPFWQEGPASRMAVTPFYQSGTMRLDAETPFSMLDANTGVDEWGGIVAPLMGWGDPSRATPLGYRGTAQSEPGALGYWRLGETSGTAADDLLGISPGTYSGSYTLNQPGMLTSSPDPAVLLSGGNVQLTDPGAILHPAEVFALSFWFDRTAFGTAQTVWSAGANDLHVGFTAGNAIRLRKQGASDVFVTTPTYATAGRHHALVWKNGATSGVFVDGAAAAGTLTNATLVASGTAPRIGALTSGGEALSARLDEVTLYGSVSDVASLASRLWSAGVGS